jgi:acetyltransferase-like isoleucine patch superfamily enzyme
MEFERGDNTAVELYKRVGWKICSTYTRSKYFKVMNIISHKASVSKLADIETSAKGSKLTIADGVMIDAFVKIKFTGGTGDISIGEGSYINSGCVLYSGNGIQIGKHVLIAANCTFAAVNHEYMQKDKLIKEQGFKKSKDGIVIGDDVWIGAGVVILGSIVSGIVEPYAVCGGNPLTIIKYRQ